MNLYLVRHGEAMREGEDAARPLNARGREEVRRLATHLARLGVRVGEIRHSPKARAAQTAEIIAGALGARARVSEGLLPEDDPTPIAATASLATDDVMLVGHLPHLGRLASLLVLGDDARSLSELRTGGLLRLQRESGLWRLGWALTPSALR